MLRQEEAKGKRERRQGGRDYNNDGTTPPCHVDHFFNEVPTKNLLEELPFARGDDLVLVVAVSVYILPANSYHMNNL